MRRPGWMLTEVLKLIVILAALGALIVALAPPNT